MARKKHVEDGGGEGWLMSYCDMITLLVTFFLMMMTFSTSEKGDLEEIGVGLLKGRGGVWPAMLGSSTAERLDTALVERLARDLDELSTESGGALGLRGAIDGLLIQFDLESSFAPGSAAPPPALVRRLEGIAERLHPYEWTMVIEGSTDSQFRPDAKHPTAIALGLARARAAADVVLSNRRVERERVQVTSFGADRPLASNDTATGRRANRCVTLRIVATSVSAAAASERARMLEAGRAR
jgi:chemotaxis protein MotB